MLCIHSGCFNASSQTGNEFASHISELSVLLLSWAPSPPDLTDFPIILSGKVSCIGCCLLDIHLGALLLVLLCLRYNDLEDPILHPRLDRLWVSLQGFTSPSQYTPVCSRKGIRARQGELTRSGRPCSM